MKLRLTLAAALAAILFATADCGQSDSPREGIVSLSPVVTEILYELGAGDRIAANTRFCNYPPQAKTKTKIGDFLNPNEEYIISMKPEIVIDTNSRAHVPLWGRLEKAGIKVVHLPIDTADQVAAAYKIVGKAVGLGKKGGELARRLLSDIEKLKTECSHVSHKKRVIFFVEYPNLTAVGGGTFIDNLISVVGGENIVSQKGWVLNFPQEKVVALKPDIIIQAVDSEKINDKFVSDLNEFYRHTNAKIHVVNADEVTRPGPRIAEGWRGIAKILHPESFEN